MVKKTQLMKSKQRVADHGEVFTPDWMVKDMLDLVRDESERIDARVLEPACGEGAFLQEVLRRKLNTVQFRYGKSEFERRNYALLALMSTYGIELLADNAQVCRDNLLAIFMDFIGEDDPKPWIDAASVILGVNIVQADALTMRRPGGEALTLPEWGYLGAGKFQRRDFIYQSLAKRADFGENTLFGEMEQDEIFKSQKAFPPMTVSEIVALGGEERDSYE